MKPDWKNSPEWANWLAGSEKGYVFFENEPQWGWDDWGVYDGDAVRASSVPSHEDFKEHRP